MQPAENVGGQWGLNKTKPDILFPKQKGGKSMDKNGQNLSGSKTKNLSVYDDGNIPEVDLPLPDDSTQDVIPDEVPRKDGPGGENSNKNNG